MKEKKEKANQIWSLFIFGLVTFMVLTILSNAWAGDDKVYKGRLSYHWGPKHFSAIMANKFAEECKKATNGRLDIEIFPSGQLANISQVVPALSQGAVDMGGVLDVILMSVDKNFYLTGMMRFFNSFEQKRDFWEKTPEGLKYWEGIQKKLGVRVLAYIPVGPTCYLTTKRPLDSIKSFEGLKSRTLVPSEKYSFEPLGINFVNVSTAEVYTALKSGMIDTLQTVPSAIETYSWWDFLKYAQLPYNFYADAYIMANSRWFDALPQDIKDIILKDVGPRISKEATDGVMAHSNATLQKFVKDHGGTISTLPASEVEKLITIEKTQVWPKLSTNIDPALYQAAKDFVGHK